MELRCACLMISLISLMKVVNGQIEPSENDYVEVLELNVLSSATMRFADVFLESVIRNKHVEDHEIDFEIRVPKTAFIHKFWLTTTNSTITAEIKEKTEAQEIYSNAQSSDLTAGQVTKRTNLKDDFDRDIFSISINVAANETVKYHLQYQQLLQRSNGKYQQSIFIDSSAKVIPKLTVTTEIKERERFESIHFQTPFEPLKQYADIEEGVTPDGMYVRKITWSPSQSEQANANLAELVRPFVIEYVLEPPGDGGYVYTNTNGEFAHIFSTECEETKIMLKKIVFVIDISGSMKGKPIMQVESAMMDVLNQLRRGDLFNIILFAKDVIEWKKGFRGATVSSINDAKYFLQTRLQANGATNINGALTLAMKYHSDHEEEGDLKYGNLILFLTDGDATHGVINRNDIRENVRNLNFYEKEKCCKTILTSIAFGTNTDIDFLRKLSLENGGSLKIIKDITSDGADNRLIETYESMENPFYLDVRFEFFVNDKPIPSENITQSTFLQYDCGSEIIVGGLFDPNENIIPQVIARGSNTELNFNSIPVFKTSVVSARFLARLVTYKRIQDLLKIVDTELDEILQDEAKDKATALAIQYGFVTRYTSLVVVNYNKPKPPVGAGTPLNRAGSSLTDIFSMPDNVFKQTTFSLEEFLFEVKSGQYSHAPSFYTYNVLGCWLFSTLLLQLVKFKSNN